jgi:hypothetical protein
MTTAWSGRRPMLLGGHKFDLRLYALVSKCDCHLWGSDGPEAWAWGMGLGHGPGAWAWGMGPWCASTV